MDNGIGKMAKIAWKQITRLIIFYPGETASLWTRPSGAHTHPSIKMKQIQDYETLKKVYCDYTGGKYGPVVSMDKMFFGLGDKKSKWEAANPDPLWYSSADVKYVKKFYDEFKEFENDENEDCDVSEITKTGKAVYQVNTLTDLAKIPVPKSGRKVTVISVYTTYRYNGSVWKLVSGGGMNPPPRTIFKCPSAATKTVESAYELKYKDGAENDSHFVLSSGSVYKYIPSVKVWRRISGNIKFCGVEDLQIHTIRIFASVSEMSHTQGIDGEKVWLKQYREEYIYRKKQLAWFRQRPKGRGPKRIPATKKAAQTLPNMPQSSPKITMPVVNTVADLDLITTSAVDGATVYVKDSGIIYTIVNGVWHVWTIPKKKSTTKVTPSTAPAPTHAKQTPKLRQRFGQIPLRKLRRYKEE